ncbi:MAG: hypothetical protein HY506_00555 [Candidatus Yanofskybacteria bacterium]|nr:hypothetical protein [Candidatus Yanofskybacteria bacterium]
MKRKDLNFYRPAKSFLKMRRFYFLVGSAVLAGLFIFSSSDYAREVSVINEPVPEKIIEFESTISWPEKVKEGMVLLEKSAPLKYQTTNGRDSGALLRKQIALAIMNKDTGEIFERRIWVSEGEIKNYHRTGVINIETEPILNTSVRSLNGNDLHIAANWWNSFNTDYKIEGRLDLVVVANKYLLLSSSLATLPERSKNKYTEIIYVPYSAGLHVSELVEAGKKYIEENISLAFGQLNDGRVLSRLTPNQLVTAGIGEDLIKNVMLIEHIDPDAFKMADDGGRLLAERVLVIIGANLKKSYRYTGSPAGASGLAQFIRPTYQDIYSIYPTAKLIKDYNLGMADHTNAVKAMVLFFDTHEKDLANKITRRNIVQPLGITEEMLAAVYNGGPGRVTKSVNKFGLAWISSQIGRSSGARILREETLDYVSKFRAIKNLDVFN